MEKKKLDSHDQVGGGGGGRGRYASRGHARGLSCTKVVSAAVSLEMNRTNGVSNLDMDIPLTSTFAFRARSHQAKAT